MADEEVPPDKADAKPERSSVPQEGVGITGDQQTLVSLIEEWIGLELERRVIPHSPERDRKTWLVTVDYLFAIARMLHKSGAPFAGDPLAFAATGILEALSGHAPKAFNPPKKRGRQAHSPTQVLMKALAVAYVQMSKKKGEYLIPDDNAIETVCDAFSISHETLYEWVENTKTNVSRQRLYSILSEIDNPKERLSVAKLYLRVANTSYRYGC